MSKRNQHPKTYSKSRGVRSINSGFGANALVLSVVLVISLASATTAVALLRDLVMSVLVFVFTLLVLLVIFPALLLLSGDIGEMSWLKVYLEVITRIPALGAFLNNIRSKR